jgi:pyruvate/2-oxoglutarate dehydrogenase complex dihydrolipoamide dehydrogenase (E3) component
MNDLDIDYVNAKASFKDQNTVKFSYKGLMETEVKSYELKGKNFLIAAGGRPR